MRCYITDPKTGKVIREEDREPICGEDFCEDCGDCLACGGSEPCYTVAKAEPGVHRFFKEGKP
jgi:hypothetical protein